MTTIKARDAAEQAAEAIRTLSHLTLPGGDGLEFPADAYLILGDLKIMAQRLPQLLHQLSLWLGTQHAAGRVGHDSRLDATPWVRLARDCLDGDATDAAGELENALNRAQNACTGLTGITAAERKD